MWCRRKRLPWHVPCQSIKGAIKTYKAITLGIRGADDDDDEPNIESFDLFSNYPSIVHFGDCGGARTKRQIKITECLQWQQALTIYWVYVFLTTNAKNKLTILCLPDHFIIIQLLWPRGRSGGTEGDVRLYPNTYFVAHVGHPLRRS